ncbi:MAG: RluA family pseudouridine synthase [Eubacteriales bacterium]|jgi:23S rRNA pseudouridine1911/1915/1917 synthase|nr:RluA family pseudouridine synthase [Eubacteriales bacterium]
MPEQERILCGVSVRLDAFVAAETELSRTQAQRMIHNGAILLNGKTVKPNAMTTEGDLVDVTYPDPVETDVKPENIPLDVLYEDEDLLVLDKPQGMVVHPAPGHASGTLVNALLHHIRDLSGIGGELRPGIVHRIDRMTSGLLVVAKNDATHRALSWQFHDHSAHRSYAALVDGNIRQDEGTIDAPLARHPVNRKRMAIVPGGREAVTHWHVAARYGQYTLLQIELETGRTHQIRVHLASQQHPVTGDELYGRDKRPFGLAGQALHGYRLVFRHPRLGERMVFYAPLPDYFSKALKKAGETEDEESILCRLKALEKTD